jgi:hypothetical protein
LLNVKKKKMIQNYQPFHILNAQADGSGHPRKRRCREIGDEGTRREGGKEDLKEINAEEN